MGQLMGIFERVDWEDRMPRNIRFMRIRVRVDPWLPVVSGFMLRLDDGSKVWIQCRYERVHKLCNRCGMIGHTRSQCSQSMEDVEMMLFRQRHNIQTRHHVHFSFDVLEPHFSNELRAFYNRRRRWTSRIRFGNIYHHHPFPQNSQQNQAQANAHVVGLQNGSTSHNQAHETNNPEYPDPDTPQIRNTTNLSFNQAQHATNHPEPDHSNLNTAINSLNLDHHPNPATPLNSPVSSHSHSAQSPVTNVNIHPNQPYPNPTLPPSESHFSTRPSWYPPTNSALKWTWMEGDGPFLTNGVLRNTSISSSETESESITATMFNLDSLNIQRAEVVPQSTWARGEIPESPESLVENLVRRVNRRRFHFELGDASNGPQLSRSQAQAYDSDRSNANRRERVLGQTNEVNLNDLGPVTGEVVGPSLEEGRVRGTISNPEGLLRSPTQDSVNSTQLDPYPLSSVQRNELRDLSVPAPSHLIGGRKRFRKEIGKVNQNIRQRLFCGFLSRGFDGERKEINDGNDGTEYEQNLVVGERMEESSTRSMYGHREAGLQQLPQQP
nr:hypothetical protein CFP56_17320 [Quercus suber]